MDRRDDEIQHLTGDRPSKRGRRVGRRAVIKVGASTAAGLALASVYIKPGVVSVGVQESYAASGDSYQGQGNSRGGDNGNQGGHNGNQGGHNGNQGGNRGNR